jgi:hypothetical protein
VFYYIVVNESRGGIESRLTNADGDSVKLCNWGEITYQQRCLVKSKRLVASSDLELIYKVKIKTRFEG